MCYRSCLIYTYIDVLLRKPFSGFEGIRRGIKLFLLKSVYKREVDGSRLSGYPMLVWHDMVDSVLELRKFGGSMPTILVQLAIDHSTKTKLFPEIGTYDVIF